MLRPKGPDRLLSIVMSWVAAVTQGGRTRLAPQQSARALTSPRCGDAYGGSEVLCQELGRIGPVGSHPCGCIEFPANRENIREFSHFRPFPSPFRRRLRQFVKQFQCVAAESLLDPEQGTFSSRTENVSAGTGNRWACAKRIEDRADRACGSDRRRRRGGDVLRAFVHDGGGHGVDRGWSK
jgi:hypothetical protein